MMDNKIELVDGSQIELKSDNDNDFGYYFTIGESVYSFDDFQYLDEKIVPVSETCSKTKRWVRKYKHISGEEVLARVDSFFHDMNIVTTEFFFSLDGHFAVLF